MTAKHKKIGISDVKEFWEKNPLSSNDIPYKIGSKEYFQYYDLEREEIESIEFSYKLHEYKNFKNKKVLDIGSGNGYVLANYAKEGADVTGVDITSKAIELCQIRFKNMNINGNFMVADAEKLPFPDEYFDCVCSMGVLHHIPNTQNAINEIFRVLKPGGRVILMFYHKNSAKYKLKYKVWSFFTNKSVEQLVDEFDGIGNPKGQAYSKKELKILLSNFTQINMFLGYLETRDIILRGARYLPSNLFKPLEKWLGWNLYAKALKSKKS